VCGQQVRGKARARVRAGGRERAVWGAHGRSAWRGALLRVEQHELEYGDGGVHAHPVDWLQRELARGDAAGEQEQTAADRRKVAREAAYRRESVVVPVLNVHAVKELRGTGWGALRCRVSYAVARIVSS
jgi:hypothetical protein